MTICKNAKVNYWAADMDLASMQAMPYIPDEEEEDDDDDADDDEQEPPTTSNGHEDDEQLDDVVERERVKLERKQKRLDERLSKNPTKDDMVVFKRMNKYMKNKSVEKINLIISFPRFNYKETFEGADRAALLLCADYHKKTHMLVAGFSNGHFYLHEMPDFNIIHSLRLSESLSS